MTDRVGHDHTSGGWGWHVYACGPDLRVVREGTANYALEAMEAADAALAAMERDDG